MKNRTAVLGLAAGALLWGCEPTPLPEPSIVSLDPAQVPAHTAAELRVHYDALLPLSLDYSRETSASATSAMKVYIGEQLAAIQRFERPSTVIVSVPADMPSGEHAVRLVLSDGRETKRTQRLVVGAAVNTLAPTGDGGTSTDGGVPDTREGEGGGTEKERGGVSGFRFDAVREQVRGVPFTLTLRAEGSQAANFQGMVTLRTSKGTVEPSVAGPFVDGVLEVKVTLGQPSHQVITAENENGIVGSSNEFMVRPY